MFYGPWVYLLVILKFSMVELKYDRTKSGRKMQPQSQTIIFHAYAHDCSFFSSRFYKKSPYCFFIPITEINLLPRISFCSFFSARPRSAEYTTGICFETAQNTKAFEWLFTGFQPFLWNFSTTKNLYSLKFWMWLATIACVVRWPICNALLNDLWLTRFTRMCNWNYWHKHHALWLS